MLVTGGEGTVAELLVNPQQLVVLGGALGARRGATLDEAAAARDGKIGDRRVFGIAGAVAPRASAIVSGVRVSVTTWLGLSTALAIL